MFWHVPKHMLGSSWGLIIHIFVVLTGIKFLSVAPGKNPRVTTGKTLQKGWLVFPVYHLWGIFMWAHFFEGIVQHNSKLWLQQQGVPIGGLLSSQAAEAFLTACELRKSLNTNWECDEKVLFMTLTKHLHSSYLYDECWDSIFSLNTFLQKAPPPHITSMTRGFFCCAL